MFANRVRSSVLSFGKRLLPGRFYEVNANGPPSTMPKDTVTTAVSFSVDEQAGTLHKILGIFHERDINLTRIESAPSKSPAWKYDIFLDFAGDQNDERVSSVLNHLQQECLSFTVLGTEITPWFPRKISDCDAFANRVLSAGSDLDSDHPGFTDPEYRQRRVAIAEVAKTYRSGDPIPLVEFTDKEVETWRVVYNNIMKQVPKHACREYQYILPLLKSYCKYSPTNIPQLRDISAFLKENTGFQLRPVAGLLSSRDFLNGLAFRVFHSTQYMRHHTMPLYTPEPDTCHELLGHAPLFADPDFADFSQELGLASLGVSDEDLKKLATCYWFTVEFGLCQQAGERKAYGAGVLSSFGELEYAMSDKPEFRQLDLESMSVQPYPITTYQPVYYVAENFQDMSRKMRAFAKTLKRPFDVKYNPYNQSVSVHDRPRHSASC